MMTDAQGLLDELAEAAERLGAAVQRQPMGGDGGGLARIKQRWVVFIDTQGDPAEQIQKIADQMPELGDLETVYLSPALRGMLGDGT
ncbi:MAG: hypothetical protein CMJ49_07545 [Planctomycetaceae bacterium]|nr:hypothetical protein [Planctomycetaceae bacterium]